MPSSVDSLFWITACFVAAPLVAGAVPRKLLPEVVLLLVLGMVVGPNVLGLAASDEAIDLLHDLGLGMLFLLAGYEIELSELTGAGGRRALRTWLVSFVLALATVWALSRVVGIHAETAVAIALTSTALGTLLPILKDAGLMGTAFGNTIMNHGAMGELCPVIAMAVLLGTRGTLASVVLLGLFFLAALLVSLPSARISATSRVLAQIRAGAETTGQTTVRLTILLLVTLLALAAVFKLDSVLGAFAAGFILRRALPGGDERLELKLTGVAFGLLVPIFFVTAGMAIDPSAVAEHTPGLVLFVLLILLVRGVPVLVASRLERDRVTGARTFSGRDSVRLGLYGATGLPIIVAVTAVAVDSGTMSATNASVLVAGGAVTVLLLPLSATLLARPEPASASAVQGPADEAQPGPAEGEHQQDGRHDGRGGRREGDAAAD
jgi:Kef-type K+ transport system membrane component KefB